MKTIISTNKSIAKTRRYIEVNIQIPKDAYVIENENIIIWKVPQSKVIRVYHKEGKTTLENMVNLVNLLHANFFKKEKILFINYIKHVTNSSKDMRQLGLNQKSLEMTKALALLVTSPISRLIGNFFMRLVNSPYPTRLFTSEQEALIWLENNTYE